MNWFIPALVKSSVGSSPGSSGLLGTTRWPCFSKYLRKERANFPGMHLSIVRAITLRGVSKDRFEAREALGDEAANDAGAALVVQIFRRLPAQPPLERPSSSAFSSTSSNTSLHGVLRGVVVDAGLADLLEDARAAAVLDGALHPRDRQRDAAIVEGAIRFEARNRPRRCSAASNSRRLRRVAAALPTARAPTAASAR